MTISGISYVRKKRGTTSAGMTSTGLGKKGLVELGLDIAETSPMDHLVIGSAAITTQNKMAIDNDESIQILEVTQTIALDKNKPTAVRIGPQQEPNLLGSRRLGDNSTEKRGSIIAKNRWKVKVTGKKTSKRGLDSTFVKLLNGNEKFEIDTLNDPELSKEEDGNGCSRAACS